MWGYRDSYHEKSVKIYPTFVGLFGYLLCVGKFGYLLFAEKDEFLPYFYNENNDLIFKKVTGISIN